MSISQAKKKKYRNFRYIMKRRRVITILSLVLCLLMLSALFTTPVYATWVYGDNSNTTSYNVLFNLSQFRFDWSGSERLPMTHFEMVNEVIYNNTFGLNAHNSPLVSHINDRIGIGYSYFASHDLLATDVAELRDNNDHLSFIVDGVNDSSLVAYIYSSDALLGTNGDAIVPVGDYCYPVYKTEIVRETLSAPWQLVSTIKGHAQSVWYKEENSGTPSPNQIPSYDISTWMENYEMGSTYDDPIWAGQGQEIEVVIEDGQEAAFYKMLPMPGECRIETTNLDAVITVRDKNRKVVSTSSVEEIDGVQTLVVTWRANGNKNKEFTVEFSGGTVIPIKLSW